MPPASYHRSYDNFFARSSALGVVTHQHAWVFVARYLGQFVHGEDRRQAGSRLVPQVVKAKVGQKLAIWLQFGPPALIDVNLAGACHCALEGSGNGVATNLEHAVGVFGRIALGVVRVFQRLEHFKPFHLPRTRLCSVAAKSTESRVEIRDTRT